MYCPFPARGMPWAGSNVFSGKGELEMEFLQENLSTILVGLLVLAAFVLIVGNAVRKQKSGKGGCSCGCGSCSGNCPFGSEAGTAPRGEEKK